jgi:hypothetical protein
LLKKQPCGCFFIDALSLQVQCQVFLAVFFLAAGFLPVALMTLVLDATSLVAGAFLAAVFFAAAFLPPGLPVASSFAAF